MAKLSELESVLTPINAALQKAATDLTTIIADLKTQIGNSSDPDLPAGAQAQLDQLNAVKDSIVAVSTTPAV